MKKTVLILMLALISLSANAQTVTIPDPYFATFLQINFPGCITGNQLDTTCPAVLSATSLNCAHDSIYDITGIKYFVNLTSLKCSGNFIGSINELPPSLTYFLCDGNMLDSLPPLPNTLRYLSCTINQLTFLPTLPPLLDTLSCGMNYITTLPALPTGLRMLNCYQNQLTTLPALDTLLVELVCNNNQLTSLPALDTALTNLNCSNNNLDSLPVLPNGLTYLSCYSNHLPILPALDTALSYLDCNTNLLDSLPALDNALTYLNCSANLLHDLPNLNSLVILNCSNNNLVTLPVLPNTLNTLTCISDSLTSLPALASVVILNCSNNFLPVFPGMPGTLTNLTCNDNLLPALPAMGTSLNYLYCSNNQLSTLPAMDNALNTLYCDNNGMTVMPAMSTSLSYLQCSNNLLTTLPALPSSLGEMHCVNNHLDSLPSLANLGKLECSSNPITALPTLPNTMYYLSCMNDSLTSLPSLPNSLNYLNCGNNSISCFPVFPFSIGDSSSLNISPNPFTCLPNYIPAMTWAMLMNPLCGVGNVSGCSPAAGIVGYAYKDSISNCIKDSTEHIFYNVPFKCYDAANNLLAQTYTAVNGIYNFPDTAGVYTVRIDTANVPYTYQCASPGVDSTVTLTTANPMVQDVNFDLICKPGFDVGTQSVVTDGWVFPGQNHTVRVVAGDMSHWYHMHCAGGISGQVKITITGPVTYAGTMAGALTPLVAGNIFTYNITDFDSINNLTAFGLIMHTNIFANNGDAVCVNVHVTPTSGDNDTVNNNFTHCYTVVNSYDPNLKETYPKEVLMGYEDYFTYTVHFQNTGTAPAMNIRLLDTLDARLDLSTFQVINYSHTNVASLTGRLLTFNFHNINLPDSTTDSEGSKGYVQYRIKPLPNQPWNTHILNRADIYFDFNPPVSTNTSENVYVRYIAPTSINETEGSSNLQLYPNPTSGNLKISIASNSKMESLHIYNVLGEEVLNSKQVSGKSEMTLDVSVLAKGLYFIEVKTENNIERSRFIKQ